MIEVIQVVLAAVFAAGGAYAAVRVELAWIRRDLDDHAARIRALENARMIRQ